MTISGAQAAALRAALAGDGGTFEYLANQFAVTSEEEFGVLTASAFIVAARRRFAAGWSIGDVIKFVGALRARNEAERADVLAGAAEQMLLGALHGRPKQGEFSELEEGYAQFALLAELVRDLDEQGLGEQGLDVLLNEACSQAERWMTKVKH
jgi:hypothetical protein